MGFQEIPLRAGLIGCGRMGSQYALALGKTRKVSLCGIYDPFLEKDHVERFGPVYRNVESLLADPRITAVIIAAPTPFHRDLCMRALHQRKHVLVEKPMALSVPEAEAMIESAESNHVKLTVGLVERFNPAYRKIKEILDLSSLGEIRSVSVTRKTKSVNRPAWYWDMEKSGGVIVDLAIHDIDLVCWLLNDEPESVYALAPSSDSPGVLDTAMLLLKFRKGTVAGLDVSWKLDPAYPSWGNIGIEILGTKGMIASDSGLGQPLYFSGKNSLSSFIHSQEDLTWTAVDLLRQDIIQLMLENFAESIIEAKAVEPSGYDGLEALQVALYAMESLDQKAPITIAAKNR